MNDIKIGDGRPGVNYIPPVITPLRGIAYNARKLARVVAPLSIDDGNDISRYQDPVNYSGLRIIDEREVLIVKATESNFWPDPLYQTHWQGAHEAGMLVSLYHFTRFDVSGTSQGEWFHNNTADFRNGIPYKKIVWLDAETLDGSTASQRHTIFNALAYYLHNQGWEVGCYSSPGFWDANMLVNGRGPDVIYEPWFYFWVAHWTGASDFILPREWTRSRVLCWQKGVSNRDSWVPETISYTSHIDYNSWLAGLDWFGTSVTNPETVSAHVKNSQPIDFLHNKWTPLPFDTVEFDTDGMFDLIAPTMLIINTPGKYIFSSQIRVPAVANPETGGIWLEVQLIRGGVPSTIAKNNKRFIPLFSTLINVNSMAENMQTGDIVRIQAYQNNGTNIQILPHQDYSPEFSAIRIGP